MPSGPGETDRTAMGRLGRAGRVGRAGQGSSRQDHRGDGEALPEHLLDLYFDGELTPAEAERLQRAAGLDRALADEIDLTERVIGGLRAPVQGPDLTAAVLERVGSRRAFLARRERAVAWRQRAAAAAVVLVGLGSVAWLQRVLPDAGRLSPRPAPVSSVAKAVAAELTVARDQGAEAVRRLTATLSDQPALPGAAPDEPVAMVAAAADGAGVVAGVVVGVVAGAADEVGSGSGSGSVVLKMNQLGMNDAGVWPSRSALGGDPFADSFADAELGLSTLISPVVSPLAEMPLSINALNGSWARAEEAGAPEWPASAGRGLAVSSRAGPGVAGAVQAGMDQLGSAAVNADWNGPVVSVRAVDPARLGLLNHSPAVLRADRAGFMAASDAPGLAAASALLRVPPLRLADVLGPIVDGPAPPGAGDPLEPIHRADE